MINTIIPQAITIKPFFLVLATALTSFCYSFLVEPLGLITITNPKINIIPPKNNGIKSYIKSSSNIFISNLYQ